MKTVRTKAKTGTFQISRVPEAVADMVVNIKKTHVYTCKKVWKRALKAERKRR